MKYRFYILFSLLTCFISCNDDKETNKTRQVHKVKSIDFEEFKLIDLTPKAQEDMKHWKSFQSLMQVIVSMAPAKIKNTDDLMLSNPDSLLVYSRLYPINSKTENINSLVERDWRAPAEASKDTVFRFEKKKNNAVASLQWSRFLVANIPYTFSVILKKVNYPKVNLNFSESNTDELSATFALDTLNSSTSNVKKTALEDDWNRYQITFSPKKSAPYTIKLSLDENAKENDNVILYRSVLELPAKYFHKVGQYSDKIVGEHSEVESSYYSVFFWLVQIEDALRELLSDDATFPEKINVPTVKARLRLFQTQIKALADNVKNNPDFKEEELKSNISLLGQTFNSVIARINNIYGNDLEERMKFIGTQDTDSILKKDVKKFE